MQNEVSDLIIRIKNAALALRREVPISYSKFNKEVGKILVKEGFLEEVKENVVEGRKSLIFTVKYDRRLPVLTDVTIISKPSLRIYQGVKNLFEIERKGRKTIIVSTNAGVMTGKDARKKGIGGEVLFAIW